MHHPIRQVELFRQQLEFPYFSRYSLANILLISEEQVLDRFFAERWKGVDWSETGRDRFGRKDSRLYSAMSMPYETRLELVTGLTNCLEEAYGPLLLSVDWDVNLYCEIFPGKDAGLLRAALYRASQFQYVHAAAQQLRLTDYDAAAAVAAGFGISEEVLFSVMESIDASMLGYVYPNTLLDMDANMRFYALLRFCERCSPVVLLPEFPTEKAAIQ